MRISNWGKFPEIEAKVNYANNIQDILEFLTIHDNIIARGMGRSYGDSSLNQKIISLIKLNRFIYIDKDSGIIKCEAGVGLDDILNLIVPNGWFLPVTPGTKHITVGGAIGSDVHGKNHHQNGNFSNYLQEFEIMLSNGEIKKCSPTENYDLFNATCGGMGLTGIILNATFIMRKIESSYIIQTTYKAKNIDEIFKLFEETNGSTYSVAWLDSMAKNKSLGRSVLMIGEHAKFEELNSKNKAKPLVPGRHPSLSIPFDMPNFVLNNFTIKLFNFLYYSKANNGKTSIVHYEPFFYPLDKIQNWNRLYGKRGFCQYQFILPLKHSYEGLKEIMTKISSNKMGSFLAVLKLYGKKGKLMSFPMEGYSIALDFQISKNLLPFLDELDEIVAKYGGRLYLTKDSRMKREFFHASYPNIAEFIDLKRKIDPNNKFQSLQSKRLEIF